ncbi:hypothetical protein Leryth_005791 [Lithospermum erythrorhizon]|nr:hypothetical protein Leryth_005791 [Lithospermum erythrorhizon]
MQLIAREDIVDEEEDMFEAIDKLIAHGINAGDVKKLQDAGIHTCNGLMMHTKKHMELKFYDWTMKRKAVIKITTGSQALDELLGGGIETNAITEAFGEFCRPDRIVPIAERFGMDPGAVLDNIIYARAYTYEHQYNLLLGLAAKMSEEPFRLLQKLAQMLSRLIKIAEEFNVAVYMTNQDPKKPAGGHVLAHAATIRLMFRKGKGEQRVCKVFDAPNLPEAEEISFPSYIFDHSLILTDPS